MKADDKKSNKTAAAQKKVEKKDDKKNATAHAQRKKEDEDIPMDAAAIKAYSSVIADAAEDSEPSNPV